jgi:hypothetical protein
VISLFLLLLLTGAGLIAVLWGGSLFLQGYFYTEPAEQLSWRAPAAAGVMTLFFGIWCFFQANSTRSPGQESNNLTIPFLFSPTEAKPPVKKLWVIRQGSKEPELYELRKTAAGATGLVSEEYRQVRPNTNRPWNPDRVKAIIVKNGEEDRFEPEKMHEGGNLRFRDKDGWVLTVYDRTLASQPTRFRLDWLLGNLLLNFFHLGLWFVCLWLLLRFQWSHALGLAIVLWLIASLLALPFLLSVARSLAGPTPV